MLGIALKDELVTILQEEHPNTYQWLAQESDEVHICRGHGKLFVIHDCKWPLIGSNPQKDAFYEVLDNQECHNYLIVEACHDYDENDIGGWYDNPWNLSKYVTVNLSSKYVTVNLSYEGDNLP